MKAILIIADGLGGRPSDMDGKTCLEAAHTPNLDELARRGAVGLIDPIKPGVRPGSDTAHLSLLGYDPYQVYTGRGVFECLGIGMNVEPGDVCFRANFATVEETPDGLKLVDRRAGRIDAGQDDLAAALAEIALSDGVKFAFKASTQHRGALRMYGGELSRAVTETDPHKAGVHVSTARALDETAAAARTAAAMNEFTRKSYEVLKDHPVNKARIAAGKPPANIVLIRGAADLPHLTPIDRLYGVHGAVVAGAALYRGIALACGMERVDAPGATGAVDTDLVSKANTAIQALEQLDYVFIHVKGTDNRGHDKDAPGKKKFIERIDAELIGTLMGKLDWNQTHLAFTGDHTTPIDYGDHTAEPVPILYVGPNVRTDAVAEFGERAAGRGGLGRWSGRALPILFNYNNWLPKFGS